MSATKTDSGVKKKVTLQETPSETWVSMAALSSAILAVCAALTSMASTSHGNAVTRDLIRNSNQWSYFQAKGIKANLLQTKLDLLSSSKRSSSDQDHQDKEKLREYRLEQEKIIEKTKEQEANIDYHVKVGGLFSRAITFFQIAIGVVAVSLLTRRKSFWFAGLGLASCGAYFAILGILS